MKRGVAAVLLIVLAVGFAVLGVWQIERRAWKLRLIADVAARTDAPAVPAPGPAAWPRVGAARDAYRHVRVVGAFDHGRETLVMASTERGPGFWVLTPLRTTAGWEVLINRGFVPSEQAPPASRAAGRVAGSLPVTGLLRVTEPGGAFLRANAPLANRWYSRDVAAIARARGLQDVAPYFIDADRTPNPGGWPVGGLTVIAFRNAHLVYALTWFGLAALSLCGLGQVLRDRR